MSASISARCGCAEANAFTIELLTPRSRLKPLLRGPPNLEKVLKIAVEFDIGREAAARRYVQLHGDCIAAVFTKETAAWVTQSGARIFRSLLCARVQECAVARVAAGEISDVDEVGASEWLARDRDVHLTAQTLGQAKGYAITLLCAALPDEEDDLGIDDAERRLPRRSSKGKGGPHEPHRLRVAQPRKRRRRRAPGVARRAKTGSRSRSEGCARPSVRAHEAALRRDRHHCIGIFAFSTIAFILALSLIRNSRSFSPGSGGRTCEPFRS